MDAHTRCNPWRVRGVERYPVIGPGGVIRGWQVTGGDFTAVYGPDGSLEKLVFWVEPGRGLDATRYYDAEAQCLVVGGAAYPVWRMLEDIPWRPAYVSETVQGYVEWVGGRLREEGVRMGARVLVNFSGGKDSMATLYIVAELSDTYGFEPHAAYVHVWPLEPERNARFAERAARSLGAEYHGLEADRAYMESRLRRTGLPYRGARWCTYQKLKPLKMLRKELFPDYVAQGERLLESWKRFRRLHQLSRRPRLTTGGMMRPIYVTSLLDVARMTRHTGHIHPDYLAGHPRVACLACPYRSLHEFPPGWVDELPDPGVVEEALKATYRLRGFGEKGISYEDYLSQNLWRYHVEEAYRLYRLRRLLEAEGVEEVDASTVNLGYRSLWTGEEPVARVVDPEEFLAECVERLTPILERVRRALEEGAACLAKTSMA